MDENDRPQFSGGRIPVGDHARARSSTVRQHSLMRLGSLDNLRWSSGNREFGRDDEGSIGSGLSRAASYEGGSRDTSYRGGSEREASRHGGSAHGGSRFGDALSMPSRNGIANGVPGVGHLDVELARLDHTGRAHSHQGHTTWHGGNFYYTNRDKAFSELPGQGGPLQDGAGLSRKAMLATAPSPPSESSSTDGESMKSPRGMRHMLKHYIFHKLRGHLDTAHPRPSHWWGMIVMPLGAFISILYVSGLNRYTLPDVDMRLLNAPLGATAVLLFAVPESKLSQPRNVIGGQLISAVIGCIIRVIFPLHLTWVGAPVAVGTAVFFMMLTRTVHPPGGATALLIASLEPRGKWASWIYVPAFAIGTIGMQIIALFMNLIAPGREYPTFWWGSDNFFGGL